MVDTISNAPQAIPANTGGGLVQFTGNATLDDRDYQSAVLAAKAKSRAFWQP